MRNMLNEKINKIERKSDKALFAGLKLRETKSCCDKCHGEMNNAKRNEGYIKGYVEDYYLLDGEFLCEKCFTKKMISQHKLFMAFILLAMLVSMPFSLMCAPFKHLWRFVKRIPRRVNYLIEKILANISSYTWKLHDKFFDKGTELFDEYLVERKNDTYEKYKRYQKYSDVFRNISFFFWETKRIRFQREMDKSFYKYWRWDLNYDERLKYLL